VAKELPPSAIDRSGKLSFHGDFLADAGEKFTSIPPQSRAAMVVSLSMATVYGILFSWHEACVVRRRV